MDDIDLDNPAWRFALRLYGRPGVAAECLRLQDEHGVDVSLLLACLWLGQERGFALEPSALAEARTLAGDWAGIAVAPLRSVRREVKRSPAIWDPAVAAFRAKVQAAEIDAERIEIALLYGWADGRVWPDDASDVDGAALRNLRLVLDGPGTGSDELPPALVLALSTIDTRDGAPRGGSDRGRDGR